MIDRLGKLAPGAWRRTRRPRASLAQEEGLAQLAIGSLAAAPMAGLVTGSSPLVLALAGGAVIAESWALSLRFAAALRGQV